MAPPAKTKMAGGARVRVGTTRPVFTRLTTADYEKLEWLAAEEGITPSMLMRVTLERMIDRKRRQQNG